MVARALRFASPRERVEAAWLLAILAVGVGLRLAFIGESFDFDELATRAIAVKPTPGAAYHQFLSTENTPPLFYAIEWIFARLSESVVWLRMPSLLAGVGTIVLVWLLGRRVFDPGAGLAAAALVALTPFAALYSTEARAYALEVMCVAGSTLLILEAVRRDRLAWWAAYGALTAVALWLHYTAIFVIVAQGGWALWAHPPHRYRVIASQAAGAITLVPWIPHISGSKAEGAIGFFSPLNWHNVKLQTGSTFVGGEYGTAAAKVVGAVVAVSLILALIRQLIPPRLNVRREVVLLVALALATPLGALAYSVLFGDIFLSRNLLASLPAVAVVTGAALTRPPRWVAAIGTAAAVIALAIVAVHSTRTSVQRSDYKAVASYLDVHAPPGAPILETPMGTHPPAHSSWRTALRIYFRRPHQIIEADLAGAAAWHTGNPHCPIFTVFPVTFLVPQTAAPPAGLRLIGRHSFPGFIPLQVNTYKRPKERGTCAENTQRPTH